jgi:hypothetical protein
MYWGMKLIKKKSIRKNNAKQKKQLKELWLDSTWKLNV